MTDPQDPLLGYAVHFTRGASPTQVAAAGPEPAMDGSRASLFAWLRWTQATDTTGYWTSISILYSGEIWPARCLHNVADGVSGVESVVRGACLSSTRLDRLQRLRDERSHYGVGFRLDRLRGLGGRQVRYLQRSSVDAQEVREKVGRRATPPVNPSDPFWRQARFIDFYDGRADGRWEEEWRVPGGLHFSPKDVAFLLLPSDLHDNARGFFKGAERANSGPAYLGPYIDSEWSADQLAEALK